jgi:ribosome-binding factor A
MKRTRRTGQIGDLIRAELANLIRDLRDPDIGFVTIVDVEISPDIRLARVHVSVIGDEAQQTKTVKALTKARTRLRHELARNAALRNTPELEFRLDHTAEFAARIESTLKSIPKIEGEPQEEPEVTPEVKNDDDDE